MRTKCISDPAGMPLVVIRDWAVQLCKSKGMSDKDSVIGAALINFFQFNHDTKINNNKQVESLNRIKEKHGELGEDLSLLQWHTNEELVTGIMSLAGRTKVIQVKTDLARFGIISIYPNPNPKFKFDNTNFFLFHPELCVDFIKNVYAGGAKIYDPRTNMNDGSTNVNYVNTETTTKTTTENNKETSFEEKAEQERKTDEEIKSTSKPDEKDLPNIKSMPLVYRFRKMIESITGNTAIDEEYGQINNAMQKVRKYLLDKFIKENGMSCKIKDDEVIELTYKALIWNNGLDYSKKVTFNNLQFNILEIIREYEKKGSPVKQKQVHVRAKNLLTFPKNNNND